MILSQTDIQLIKKYFQSKPVLKAYLFGSFAEGNADDQSDIDILVDLDYSKHIGMDFVLMKDDLEQSLHKKVDLVSSNAISKYILPFIEKQKVLIYEK